MMKNLSYHLMPLTSFGICEVYIKLKWIHGMKICQTSVLFQSRSGYIFFVLFVRWLFSSLWLTRKELLSVRLLLVGNSFPVDGGMVLIVWHRLVDIFGG